MAAELGVAFLERLLLLSERSPDRRRAASAAPDYNTLRTASMIARFESVLNAAERAGAVTIRQGKRERKHLIERVTVKDHVILARHLGRTPARLAASETKEALKVVVESAPDWVRDVLDEIERRWARSEPALRLAPNAVEPAQEFFTLLTAIANYQARGLDARTFSLRATGDSKAFERHATRLSAVVAHHFGAPDLTADAVWSHVGLARFAHPVHLRGPVMVKDTAGLAIAGLTKPFASLHPETFPRLQMTSPPRALLTIENYASFNRYVRELDDGALVVYTGGFPSAGVVDLLTRVLKALESDVPFFHWGDIDPGGLRIFRFLEETLPRPPKPHQMDYAIAQAKGRLVSPDPSLAPLAASSSRIAQLAAHLCGGNDIRHLEQEALDPVSPLPARNS